MSEILPKSGEGGFVGGDGAQRCMRLWIHGEYLRGWKEQGEGNCHRISLVGGQGEIWS